MEKLKMQTPDLTDKNIEQLAVIFPQVITESRDEFGRIKKAVDFDLLKQTLSNNLVEGDDERYRLDWPGKKAALLKANTPINKTLRPCREESVNFDTTENLYIEGDNFEVLKILQESYLGQIKMIYIDPPYNTGNDFIYKDDFKQSKEDYEAELGTTDEEGGKLFRNTDSNGRFHSDWLSMMYERLLVARDLLKDDGVIFISIDDNEVHNLRKICDQVYGEENFVTSLHVEMSATQGMKVKAAKNGNIVKNGEYILIYSKDGHKNVGQKPLLSPSLYDNHYSIYINAIEDGLFEEIPLQEKIKENKKIVNELLLLGLIQSNKSNIDFQRCYMYSPMFREYINNSAENIVRTHDTIELPTEFTNKVKDNLIRKYSSKTRGYLVAKANNGNFYQKIQLSEKIKYADDFFNTFGPTTIRGDWWDGYYLDMGNITREGEIDYKNGKKPIRLIMDLINFVSKSNDLILDFFSGSSSTAHAVMKLNSKDKGNRKFIMVQLPELIEPNTPDNRKYISYLQSINVPPIVTEIGKERIRRAGKKILEENADNLKYREKDLDIGFRVYKTDSTNLKEVFYHPAELKQDFLAHLESNIKEDRSPEDLLTQVILDLGLELSLPIEIKIMQNNTVYLVQTNALAACFDNNIDFKIVDQIAELKPLKVVFKDASFKDDKDRINVTERFKRLSPETKVTVI